MKRWILLSIIFVAIFVVIMAGLGWLNFEHTVSVVKSKVVNYLIDDVPGTASNETYPVILVHGLNAIYSGRISEYSMKEMQDELSNDLGYVNKGILTEATTCAELKYAFKPIIVRSTYLRPFELQEVEDYANSLDLMISKVRYCTGAEKVDIVTHSMGGLITRYYIKNINDTTIRKLIMISTPNKGEVYNVGELAPILIEDGESILHFDFLQLSNDHNFIRKLNEYDETPGEIQYYTIEADSGDGKGDGVVRSDSVSIDGEMEHEVVECSHMDSKRPSKCPAAYEYIKTYLES